MTKCHSYVAPRLLLAHFVSLRIFAPPSHVWPVACILITQGDVLHSVSPWPLPKKEINSYSFNSILRFTALSTTTLINSTYPGPPNREPPPLRSGLGMTYPKRALLCLSETLAFLVLPDASRFLSLCLPNIPCPSMFSILHSFYPHIIFIICIRILIIIHIKSRSF